jgi:hypothetical protein
MRRQTPSIGTSTVSVGSSLMALVGSRRSTASRPCHISRSARWPIA